MLEQIEFTINAVQFLLIALVLLPHITIGTKTSQLLVQNSKQIIKKAVFSNMESHVQLTKYKTQNYTLTFSPHLISVSSKIYLSYEVLVFHNAMLTIILIFFSSDLSKYILPTLNPTALNG